MDPGARLYIVKSSRRFPVGFLSLAACLALSETAFFSVNLQGQQELKAAYEAAQRSFQHGEDAEARKQFQDLLATVYRSRVDLYFQAGAWRKAKDDLEAALALQPDFRSARKDLAYADFRLGDYLETIHTLEPLLQSVPRDAQAHGLLGRAYFSLGKVESAREELTRALELDPQDSLTTYTLALVYLRQRDRDEAARIFSELGKQQGSPPRFHLLVGRAYSDAGYEREAQDELKEALRAEPRLQFDRYFLALSLLRERKAPALEQGKKELAEELKLFPNEFAARYLLGLLLEFERRWKEAAPELLQATRLSSDSPDPYIHLGSVYLELGEAGSAVEALQNALRLTKEASEARFRAHYLLSRAYRALGDQPASLQEMASARLSRDALAEKDRKPSQEGSLREALVEVSDLEQTVSWEDLATPRELTLDENRLLSVYGQVLADAENYLGLIAARHSQFDEAAKYFERVRALEPGFPDVEANLGIALHHVGRYSEATQHLERAVERSPSDLRAKEYLGLSYSELEQHTKALPLLEAVRRSRPDDEQVLLALADALALSGQTDQAQRVIEQLLKLHPDSAALHVLWGRAYASQGQPGEARREFERALEIDPRVREAHFYLGIMSFQQAKPDAAAREFQAELANNPVDTRSRYHLAVTLLLERRLDEGLDLLRQVIHERPDYAAAHYSLGKALLAQGKLDQATRELETAVKLDPGAAYGHYQLGRAYVLAGRTQDAEREFQTTQNLKKKSGPSRDSLPQ
jgi:tetratricopeptide (TPR) repeat protein